MVYDLPSTVQATCALLAVVGAGTVSWVNTSAMDCWGNEQALAGMGGPGSEVH